MQTAKKECYEVKNIIQPVLSLVPEHIGCIFYWAILNASHTSLFSGVVYSLYLQGKVYFFKF